MKLSLPKFLLAAPACLAISTGSLLAQDEAPLAKRAAALGALAHLPASTEGAFSIKDLNGGFNAIVTSKVFQRILELSGQSGDAADDAINQAREALKTYAGEEIVFAYAKGTSTEMRRLMNVYDVYVRMNYGSIGRALASGDLDSGGVDPEMMLKDMKKLLADANSPMSKALDAIQMPPLIIGSKMGDAANAVVAQMNELEGQLPPFVTVSKFDVNGSEFKSMAINLKDVFDENAQAQMEDFLDDKATSDRIAKAIRGKRIEISYGSIGDYFVIGLGRDHSHLNFVEDPAESLVAHPHFKKLDPYLDKPIHGVVFSSEELLKAQDTSQFIQTMTDSFVAGIGSEGSVMMKKLGGKVKKMGELMARANKRSVSGYVGVMYGGNGLTGEGFGGWMLDSIDGKKPLTFANAKLGDTFLVVASAMKQKYDDLGIEMMETMASVVPLGMEMYGEISGDVDTVNKFEEMHKLFAPKIGKIWGIMKSKVYRGLGNDSALIVDLNGSLPKIPGLPRAIVNQGKAPRIAMASTVKDRKMLTAAWQELVPAVNDMLASIPGQEAGAEVQMPDALSSEKDGLATHYFPMPFLSNDFMPSLSISDKVFLMSSSKKFSESIAAKTSKAEGKGDLRGVYMRVNFTQLNSFASGWLKLIKENKDIVFEGNEFAAEDFEEGAEIALQALKLARVLKHFDYNKFTTDADETRSIWHLRLKDVK